jgi:transposase
MAAIGSYRARAAAAGRSIERIVAIYEAGWSGFWLARWLTARGIDVHVVQPSSVLVDRRMRHAKSDGIDADLLLRTLLAWLRGEPRVCSMVPVPDEKDEDARRRSMRERAELVAERIGLTNAIGAILATLGTGDFNPLRRDRRRKLEELRTALDTPLPPHAKSKINRLLTRLELVLDQICQIEQERDLILQAEQPDAAGRMIQQLIQLRGIGVQSATVVVREAFVRRFANGKALGAYAGLSPTAVAEWKGSRGSAKREIGGFEVLWSNLRGSGSAISRIPCRYAGSGNALVRRASACARS